MQTTTNQMLHIFSELVVINFCHCRIRSLLSVANLPGVNALLKNLRTKNLDQIHYEKYVRLHQTCEHLLQSSDQHDPLAD